MKSMIDAENNPLKTVITASRAHELWMIDDSIISVSGPIVANRKKTATDSWRIDLRSIVFHVLLDCVFIRTAPDNKTFRCLRQITNLDTKFSLKLRVIVGTLLQIQLQE
ncbi:MAG TPA: hypothetical protein DCQ28_05795 [Bacteroidetes bacterium]|nr:hypothetical protein [Bacteroidota bacterium]